MSKNYSPSEGVAPDDPLWTILLSQRDLGLRVPINFVTLPAISLTSACILDGRYEDEAFATCFSNLLAIGFRRFDVDLYWDQNRTSWSFCPVAIPSSIPISGVPSTATIDGSSALRSASSRSLSTSGTGQSQSLSNLTSPTPTQSTGLNPRQATLTASHLSRGSSLGATPPDTSITPETPTLPLIRVGQFKCSTTINLSVFTSLLFDYIRQTEDTLRAHLIYTTFNIHAASTFDSPDSPAPRPTRLPAPIQQLGSIFSGNFSTYIYRPEELRADRSNLNSSWYTVSEINRPIEYYYTTKTDENGIVSTEDGWPSESYIEFSKSKRLLLGWGDVDPQMSSYDFNSDAPVIFDRGFIADTQTDVEIANGNRITDGCFLRNGIPELAQANSSWAISDTIPNFNYPTTSNAGKYIQPLLSLTRNYTACGISPHLNHTLLANTAAQDHVPYLLYANATIWSWAPGQPTNDSTSQHSNDNDANTALYRCAATSPTTGLWSVSDCSSRFLAACRSLTQPYNWTLTTYEISYSFATQACDDGYQFAAPNTALENAYLTKHIRDIGREGKVWVDFNALNVETCWVTGGSDASCPYGGRGYADDLARRTILVPTIAAIIVLIISALTVFVKMAGNSKSRRRTRRRKKRADNGFVYEGVPS